VLDVGGGEGYLAAELAKRGFRVTCLAKPGTVRDALGSGTRTVEADLDFALPELDVSFDFVVLGDVLEHLREPARVLAWVATLLTPRGELVASLPNGAHLYVRMRVLFGEFPQHERGLFDRSHLHYYSWRGWQEVFRQAGVSVDLCGVTPIPFSLAFPPWVPAAVGLQAERIYGGVANVWQRLLAYQFVVRGRPIHAESLATGESPWVEAAPQRPPVENERSRRR
jgi:SAM-dependent methyltransferase